MEIDEEVKRELAELAKYNRMHTPIYLWEISKEHMNIHESAYKKTLELESKGETETPEYREFEVKYQHSAFVSIVFAAMFIEGSIYNFGSIYLGDKYLKENLDKLAPLSKLQVVLKLVTGKELDSSGQAYEYFKILISYRNRLVHPKSIPLKFGEVALDMQQKRDESFTQAIMAAKYAAYHLNEETKLLNKDKHHPGLFGLGF